MLKCSAWELPDFLYSEPRYKQFIQLFHKYFLSASFIPYAVCQPQKLTNRLPSSDVLKKALLFVCRPLACCSLLTSLLNLPGLQSFLFSAFGCKFHYSKVAFSSWYSLFLYFSLLDFWVPYRDLLHNGVHLFQARNRSLNNFCVTQNHWKHFTFSFAF